MSGSSTFPAHDPRRGGAGALRPLGYAVAASAVATLLTRLVAPLRAVFGAAERLLYATSLGWLVVATVALIGV